MLLQQPLPRQEQSRRPSAPMAPEARLASINNLLADLGDILADQDDAVSTVPSVTAALDHRNRRTREDDRHSSAGSSTGSSLQRNEDYDFDYDVEADIEIDDSSALGSRAATPLGGGGGHHTLDPRASTLSAATAVDPTQKAQWADELVRPLPSEVSVASLLAQRTDTLSTFFDKLSLSPQTRAKKWKRRFVILSGQKLYLFRSNRPTETALSVFFLRRSTDVLLSDNEDPSGLPILTIRTEHVLRCPDGSSSEPLYGARSWRMRCDSEDLGTEWLIHLQDVVESRQSSATIESRHPVSASELSARASGAGTLTMVGDGDSVLEADFSMLQQQLQATQGAKAMATRRTPVPLMAALAQYGLDASGGSVSAGGSARSSLDQPRPISGGSTRPQVEQPPPVFPPRSVFVHPTAIDHSASDRPPAGYRPFADVQQASQPYPVGPSFGASPTPEAFYPQAQQLIQQQQQQQPQAMAGPQVFHHRTERAWLPPSPTSPSPHQLFPQHQSTSLHGIDPQARANLYTQPPLAQPQYVPNPQQTPIHPGHAYPSAPPQSMMHPSMAPPTNTYTHNPAVFANPALFSSSFVSPLSSAVHSANVSSVSSNNSTLTYMSPSTPPPMPYHQGLHQSPIPRMADDARSVRSAGSTPSSSAAAAVSPGFAMDHILSPAYSTASSNHSTRAGAGVSSSTATSSVSAGSGMSWGPRSPSAGAARKSMDSSSRRSEDSRKKKKDRDLDHMPLLTSNDIMMGGASMSQRARSTRK
ncbi:hypothetical protein DFJ73DRAFT_863304 [Zopfochytrium polystomum]|nr:hypothetical protein DFJ73DRAFT_863304 [Zopfochytrium polystomum]